MSDTNLLNVPPLSRPQPSLKKIDAANKLIASSTSGPGWTSALTSPGEIKVGLSYVLDGIAGRDLSLVRDGALTTLGQAFAFVYGWMTLGTYFTTAADVTAYFFAHSSAVISKVSAIANAIFTHPGIIYSTLGMGTIISLINGFYESSGIYRQIKMRQMLKFSEPITEDNALIKFNNLLAFFKLNQQQSTELAKIIEKKVNEQSTDPSEIHSTQKRIQETWLLKLGELTGPWLAKEIHDEVHHHFYYYLHGSDTEKKAALNWIQETYALMNVQSKKSLLFRSIGLSAILLGVIATGISFITVPYVLPIFMALVVLSVGLATARYVIYNGYFSSRGWTFIPANLIPVPVRKIANKAKEIIWPSFNKEPAEIKSQPSAKSLTVSSKDEMKSQPFVKPLTVSIKEAINVDREKKVSTLADNIFSFTSWFDLGYNHLLAISA